MFGQLKLQSDIADEELIKSPENVFVDIQI